MRLRCFALTVLYGICVWSGLLRQKQQAFGPEQMNKNADASSDLSVK